VELHLLSPHVFMGWRSIKHRVRLDGVVLGYAQGQIYLYVYLYLYLYPHVCLETQHFQFRGEVLKVARFEVFTAVKIHVEVFWVMTP
jgi:hypothetical protein